MLQESRDQREINLMICVTRDDASGFGIEIFRVTMGLFICSGCSVKLQIVEYALTPLDLVVCRYIVPHH